ncbi:DMP19 family protein [Lysinibacter cavernae]|uniref:DNA mimic protein DMP19 C-terminal domain-containing protein n=1 Tax=Lysinibacter cavernae TaxID=1640652 RepID=A0A7X5TSM4_9MICO|nr:hypothetical protein [Lysinibacter cavernae]NIH53646.1 hypothetical protein [Lysinibacter cavernae]
MVNWFRRQQPNAAKPTLASLFAALDDPDTAATLANAGLSETIRLANDVDYQVTKGGFAQLLYNLKGEGLSAVEDMLIEVGAPRTQDVYVRAITVCLEQQDEYQRFLAEPFPTPNEVKHSLQLLSIEYFNGPTLPDEAAAWCSTIAAKYRIAGSGKTA